MPTGILNLANLLVGSQGNITELEKIAASKAALAEDAVAEADQAQEDVILAKNQATKIRAQIAQSLGITQIFEAEVAKTKADRDLIIKSRDELKSVNNGLAEELKKAQSELEKLRTAPAAPVQQTVAAVQTVENKTPEKKSLWQRLNEDF